MTVVVVKMNISIYFDIKSKWIFSQLLLTNGLFTFLRKINLQFLQTFL